MAVEGFMVCGISCLMWNIIESIKEVGISKTAKGDPGCRKTWWGSSAWSRPVLWSCWWWHWCFIEDLTCTKHLRCFPPSNPHNDHFQMVAERSKSLAQGYTVRGGAGIWNQDALLHPLDELKVIKIKKNGTRDVFQRQKPQCLVTD